MGNAVDLTDPRYYQHKSAKAKKLMALEKPITVVKKEKVNTTEESFAQQKLKAVKQQKQRDEQLVTEAVHRVEEKTHADVQHVTELMQQEQSMREQLSQEMR